MTLYFLFIAMGISSIVIFIAIGAIVGKKIYLSHYGMKEDVIIDNLVMCTNCFSVIVVSKKSVWKETDDGKSEFLTCGNCQCSTLYLLNNLQASNVTRPKKGN